jgi:hypothetical protein
VPIVLKSGSLNLLEPSRTVQVCTGIALPLPFTYKLVIFLFYPRELLTSTGSV